MSQTLKSSLSLTKSINTRSVCMIISLAAICLHQGACNSESKDLSRTMIAVAQANTEIINTHLDLRNGSPKNCNKVAGKLLGYLETHKSSLFGLEGRLKKLSAAERKQLRARLTRQKYGAITVRLKGAMAKFKRQCPAPAEAIESLSARIRREQPFPK